MLSFVFALFVGGVAEAAGTVNAPIGWEAAPDVSLDHVTGAAQMRPDNAPGKPHEVHARLLFDQEDVRPGETIRVGLHLQQNENWHTYWKSPGDTGLPTEIAWATPAGVSVGPFEFPVPHQFVVPVSTSYGYEGEVLLFTEMTFSEAASLGPTTIGVEANWLACEVSCIPGAVKLERTIEVVADGAPTPSSTAPLFDHAKRFQPVAAPDGVKIKGSLDKETVAPETVFKATFDVRHAGSVDKDESGWPFFIPIKGDQWMINSLQFESIEGGTRVLLEGETFEPEELPKFDTVGGLFTFNVDGEIIRTEYTIPLVWTSGVDTPPAAVASPAASEGNEAPVAPAEERSMLFMLMLAFFGGVLLNIMPCVLPVLSLKIYSLVEHSDAGSGERRKAGIGYTIGVLASFLALGGTVVVMKTVLGMQLGWGYQFQSPAYVIALATIVFVFGLSLFGVFEVPAFGASKMSQAQNKEGMVGHILTGAFATLLATPCSAPFLGTGMGFAFTLPSWGVLLFFGVAGLGLAAPFLVVAYVPALAKFLPKPGAWMDTFKQFMGFTLIATTVWLVGVLAVQTGVDGAMGFLAFLMVVSMGCWILGRWGGPIASDKAKVVSLLVALVISILAGWNFLETEYAEEGACADDGTVQTSLDFSEEVPWQPFSEERINALAGKTVFVDFTAEWCLSCKANEKGVLATEAVRFSMRDNDVVPLKADWTRRDPEITKWLTRYGRAGVPFYLVIPADRSREHIPLPELITTGIVTEALEKGR
jgi:thiol:disulfide interchange protein/DsbC/DsbD-like thiol-disulfide interchange protein